MIPYMIGKLAPNSSYLTRGLVKYVPGRYYFRAVPSQNGDILVTSPPPPIVERLECGGGSDVNYDSNIESSADPSGASEGGPGPDSSLYTTRGYDGPAPVDEGRDDVCNEI